MWKSDYVEVNVNILTKFVHGKILNVRIMYTIKQNILITHCNLLHRRKIKAYLV